MIAGVMRHLRLVPAMYSDLERGAYMLRGVGGNGKTEIWTSDPTGSTAVDYAREQGGGLSVVGELRAALERMDSNAVTIVRSLDQIVGCYVAGRDLMAVELPTLHSTWTESDFAEAERRAHQRRARGPRGGPQKPQDRREALHRTELSSTG